MEDLRKQFPALQSQTYLNTASSGLLCKRVYNWRNEESLYHLTNGGDFERHQQLLNNARKKVADFLFTQEENTALVPNFSFGLNTILEGLPRGQKVLLLKNDYPSINWPVERRDFNVCYAEINANLEQNIEKAITENKPDVFIFSIVQWLNGVKIDFNFLNQLKAYHPNLLLIADGTQYLGTEVFNFEESPIDVLGTSAYKWLLSGFGCGFFAIKEQARDRIFLNTIGFASGKGMDSHPDEVAYMKHFEPGHLDYQSFGSMLKALEFFEEFGREKIQAQIEAISKKAKQKLVEIGRLEEWVLNRHAHSSIFNIKGDEALFEKLSKNNIKASLRGNGIRVAFHFYNTEEDLEKLISVLNS